MNVSVISIDSDEGKTNKNKNKTEYPWLTNDTKNHKNEMKLHYEIFDFYNYIKPEKKDYDIRKETFKEMKHLIKTNFPEWEVFLFGSFSSDIFLKNSDIDISIITTYPENYKNSNLENLENEKKLNTNNPNENFAKNFIKNNNNNSKKNLWTNEEKESDSENPFNQNQQKINREKLIEENRLKFFSLLKNSHKFSEVEKIESKNAAILTCLGDGGLGIGDWGLGPIPNPQSPIPNPQSPLFNYFIV